jgi:uncharacterized protein
MVPEARPVALVTGASGGIGRAFALALAGRGHDLVLVARDTARLEAVAKEAADASGATAEVLTADLSDSVALASVEARLQGTGRPVDLLVNNAAFGTFGNFAELPVERETQEIQLNVVALMRLTHAGVTGMVARGRGGVINVASIGGMQPTPGYATYGGTKAFVISFTEAIHEELKGTGVKCMVLSPGFTRTEFQDNAGVDPTEVPDFMWQDAPTVVDYALKAYDRGRASCVPGPLNAATAAFTQVSPNVVTRKVAALVARRTDR